MGALQSCTKPSMDPCVWSSFESILYGFPCGEHLLWLLLEGAFLAWSCESSMAMCFVGLCSQGLAHLDGLMQKRCNSSVLAMEFCLFCSLRSEVKVHHYLPNPWNCEIEDHNAYNSLKFGLCCCYIWKLWSQLFQHPQIFFFCLQTFYRMLIYWCQTRGRFVPNCVVDIRECARLEL